MLRQSIKSLMLFLMFSFALPFASYAQQGRVDLGEDLPWLRGNDSGIQPSYNVSASQNSKFMLPDGAKPVDGSLPPDSPEMRYLDEPSTNRPFMVDRTLDRNYVDKQYAVLKVLDKVTAKVSTVKAKVGSTVKFGWIEIMLREAKKTPPEEEPEASAFIEVIAKQSEKTSKQIFSGFIFASSPSISGLEHPRYDIRLFDCLNQDELDPKPKAVEPKEDEKDNDKTKDKADSKAKAKDDKEKKPVAKKTIADEQPAEEPAFVEQEEMIEDVD